MKTKITSNVLEDISKRLLGGSISTKGEKALVVFNGSNIRLDKKLNLIKELKNKGMKTSLAFSFMAEGLLDIEKIINLLTPENAYKEVDIFKLQNIAKEHSLIIGPNITMNTLSKVSLGMIDSFVPNLIWTFIYQGKKVYLDFTSVRNYLGQETKNKEILNIAEMYINNVKKMGVIEINDADYLEKVVLENETHQDGSKKEATNMENKKVITEKDILSLSPNHRLILPKGTIVTPLAKDKAGEMNINIEIK